MSWSGFAQRGGGGGGGGGSGGFGNRGGGGGGHPAGAGNCYRCNKPGHFASNCPSLAKDAADGPDCRCGSGTKAVRRTSYKQVESGKDFWCCPNGAQGSNDGCKFFAWADGPSQGGGSSQRSWQGGSQRGGGGGGAPAASSSSSGAHSSADTAARKAAAVAIVPRDTPAEAERRYATLSTELRSKLLPHQVSGVKFALRFRGRALLGDEMGLGKTAQALAVAACYREEWPLLIACPTSLMENWRNELKKWLGPELLGAASVAGGGSKAKGKGKRKRAAAVDEYGVQIISKTAEFDASKVAPVTIVSYGLIPKIAEAAKGLFLVVVCDESHFLKSRETQRTLAMTPLLRGARRALLLSGTPSLNRYIRVPAVDSLSNPCC